jgi:hypothetical protein
MVKIQDMNFEGVVQHELSFFAEEDVKWHNHSAIWFDGVLQN